MGLRESALFLFLLISAFIDAKTREVSIRILVIFGCIGIIFYFIGQPVSLGEELLGIGIGVIVLCICRLTGGKIGEGDGWLMIVTGIYLGLYRNIELLSGGLFLSALWAVGLIVLKKAERNREMPFIPFLFLSYLRMVVV